MVSHSPLLSSGPSQPRLGLGAPQFHGHWLNALPRASVSPSAEQSKLGGCSAQLGAPQGPLQLCPARCQGPAPGCADALLGSQQAQHLEHKSPGTRSASRVPPSPNPAVTEPATDSTGRRAQAQCPKPRRAEPWQRGAKPAPRLNPCGAPALRSLCREGAQCKGNKENNGVRAPSRQQAPSGREPQAQPSRSVHGPTRGSAPRCPWELLSGRGVTGPGWGRRGRTLNSAESRGL